MSDCIFCKIACGDSPAKIVYQDDLCLAFNDLHPKAPVHLLLIPKQHIANLYDIGPEHRDIMSQLMLTIPKVAKKVGLENGFRTITNTGQGGRQEIYHLHFHILGGGTLKPM
ncbi:histidine triad nucleotide-binding protein [Spartinivicinus poritis]|uniref:Histidine triad nucleotide-binding protein n=1 Tax=Spartinivicinus poritis TaxID=2994640 RepID=A0ABT5U5U1_9GAMM|nr:histidine triad nucleotide-binding protein [Spartinivicinus sp. A2-2]MDE1461725.1 histidine triad nucleotide-binding protein [Spartinivicinus sp. A2-2]